MGKIEKGMKEFFKNPFGSSGSKDKKFKGTGHVIGTKADQQRLAVRTHPVGRAPSFQHSPTCNHLGFRWA